MPIWVEKSVVLAIHDEQLSEHGGLSGLRDENALDSALDRPKNLEAYGSDDLIDLAAAYAFGIARNHGFTDGNKRVSAVVTELFLSLNCLTFEASDTEIVSTWLSIAAGSMDEAAISAWLRSRAKVSV